MSTNVKKKEKSIY